MCFRPVQFHQGYPLATRKRYNVPLPLLIHHPAAIHFFHMLAAPTMLKHCDVVKAEGVFLSARCLVRRAYTSFWAKGLSTLRVGDVTRWVMSASQTTHNGTALANLVDMTEETGALRSDHPAIKSPNIEEQYSGFPSRA